MPLVMRTVVSTLLAGVLQHAADWPQFRGPNGRGVAEAGTLPAEFGPAKNVAWRTALPSGHSSPVITGNLIFLTAADEGKRVPAPLQKVADEGGKLFTICLDRATGKILWQREAPRARSEPFQATNSPASPSAVTDGKSVWVFFGDFGLISYSLEGKERWRLPLGPFNNTNGHGSSPILAGDLVLLLCDQDTDSYLIAAEKDTGKIRWKVDRPEATRCYSTPALLRPKHGAVEVVVPGAFQLTSYDAATGDKLWWVRGMSWQPKSTPVVDGEIVYAHWWEAGGEADQPTETPPFEEVLSRLDLDHDGRLSPSEVSSDARLARGFADMDLNSDGWLDANDWNFYRARRASRNSLVAVRRGPKGDLTTSHVLWRMQKFLPNVPSPVLYEGVLYLIKDGGILSAVDAKDGTILKQGRLPNALGTYYASPVAGDGKVYLVSQQGKATVIKAGRQWEILSSSDMDDEVYATPALVDNRIYLRTRSALYSFAAPSR
jgi:outer membrane protein assembly factor BamB